MTGWGMSSIARAVRMARVTARSLGHPMEASMVFVWATDWGSRSESRLARSKGTRKGTALDQLSESRLACGKAYEKAMSMGRLSVRNLAAQWVPLMVAPTAPRWG